MQFLSLNTYLMNSNTDIFQMCFLFTLNSDSCFLLIRFWWPNMVRGRKISSSFTHIPLKSGETHSTLKKKKGRNKKEYSVKEEVFLKEKLEGNKTETPLFIRVCKGISIAFSSRLFFVCVCVCVLVTWSCLTLCHPMDCVWPRRHLCV